MKLLKMRKYDGNRKYDKKRFWIKNRGIIKSEILKRESIWDK